MRIIVHSSYSYVKKVNNYGSLLQYFALQEALAKMGHDVCWLRICLQKKIPTGLNRWLRETILHSNFKLSEMVYHNREGFARFMDKYIHLTDLEYTETKTLKTKLQDADLYIVGSDQVWNGFSGERYLNYVPSNRPKISYAVSFGRHNIPGYMKPLLWYLLRGFKAISIREQTGVDICHKLGRKDAVHAIDPSFLLTRNDYGEYIRKDSEVKNIEGKYIYGYFVNPFPNNKLCHKGQVDEYIKSIDTRFVVTGIQNAEAALTDYTQIQPSPLEWVNNIIRAEAILTNSFHGIAYSINMNKPFLFMPQEGAMSNQNGRHIDILKMVGLESRVFDPLKGSLEEQMNAAIDWVKVNERVESFRQESFDYLKKQLY